MISFPYDITCTMTRIHHFHTQEPIEKILSPTTFTPSHPTPTSSQPSQLSQSYTLPSSHPTTSSSGISPWQPSLPRKVMPSLQDEESSMFFQDLKLSWNGQGPPPHPDIIPLGPTFRTGEIHGVGGKFHAVLHV